MLADGPFGSWAKYRAEWPGLSAEAFTLSSTSWERTVDTAHSDDRHSVRPRAGLEVAVAMFDR